MTRSGSQYSVPRDANRVPFLVVASSADGKTPVPLEANPTTNRLLVESAGSTGQGKTLLFGVISGSGSITLVAAQGGSLKIKVVSYVFSMSLEGTAKFTDDSADLTGLMDFAKEGGVSAIGQPSAHLFETQANNNLKMVVNTGSAHGHFSYYVEA